jgi:signal transduction histidine kinase
MTLRRRWDQLPAPIRVVAKNALALAAYVAAERLGLAFRYQNSFASPVWAASGVALASLLLMGWEVVPGIFIASFVNLSYQNSPMVAAIGISLGNLLEAVVSAWLLRRAGFNAALSRMRDVMALAFFGAVLASGLGALMGNLSLVAAGAMSWPGFRASLWVWWVGDALGILVVAPVIFTLAAGRRARPRSRDLEAFCVAALISLMGFFVFGGAYDQGVFRLSLVYAIFPLGFWAAYRHGTRGAAMATFLAAAFAVLGLVRGQGPFARQATHESALLMATFFALLGLTNLLLAAAMAEQRAGERERLIHTRLIELATESIGMCTPDGRVTLLNRAGREMLGLRPGSDLNGVNVLSFLETDERNRFFREVLPKVQSTGVWSGRLMVLAQGASSSFPAQYFFFPIQDPRTGATLAFGAIGHDLREAERSEAALRQTQRLESLGVLAGGIAHDYNNLLTAVLGHLDLARESVEPDSPAAEHIHSVIMLAERSGALTRQLLAYAGRGGGARERLDLQVLVREMVDLLRGSLSRKAELELDFPGPLPFVEADRVQMEQVLMNLLVNASEALEDCAGLIRLRLRALALDGVELARRFPGQDLPAGGYVELEVSDTGAGMPESVLERIFDPFFTTKFEGRGLGLSAIRGIMQAHGGAIAVQSEPGRGTVFTLLIPASGSERPL